MERDLEVQAERHPEFLLLRVKGDLRLWNNAEAEIGLLRAIKSELASSPKQLLMSLSEVKHLDTRGIRAMVHVLVECCKLKIEFKVVMPLGVPGQALAFTRIFEAWPRFSDEAEALRTLAG